MESYPTIRLGLSEAFMNKENIRGNKNAFGDSFQTTEVSRKNFITHIQAGKAWTVSAYKEGRKKESFISSQILALDCDDNVSVQSALAHPFVGQYAFYVYPSASSTPEDPRTRIVFILSAPVADWHRWEALQLGLMAHLVDLKPDPSCKDSSRMFYGSTVPGAYVNYNATLPIEIAGGLTQRQAKDDMQLDMKAKTVQHFSKQKTATGGKLSQKLAEDVETRLGVANEAYAANGFTRLPIPCPIKAHEHDHERPATYWNREKKFAYCFKCGATYLTHPVAAELGLDIASYYRHDQIEDDPSIIKVSHRYITECDISKLIGQGHSTLLVKSPTGTGKTEMIKQFSKQPDTRILVIAHRRKLIASQTARLNADPDCQTPFVSYDGLSAQEVRLAQRLCICTNSLPKLIAMDQLAPTFDVIIIDEIEQQLKHLVGDTFDGSEAVEALQTLNTLMKPDCIVVGLDAYASELSLNWMKDACQVDTFRMIVNTYPVQKGNMHLLSTLPELLEKAHEAIEDFRDERTIVFAVSSKTVAKQLYSYFTGAPILTLEEQLELGKELPANVVAALEAGHHKIDTGKVVLVYGDNTDTTATRDFIDHINERMPGVKILIYTSAMGTGIDIQAPVKAVFGIFSSGILPADEAMQMLARCRKAQEFYVCLQGGAGYRETDYEQLYQSQIDNINHTGTLLGSAYRVGWKTDSEGIIRIDDNNMVYLQFWSRVTSVINMAHNQFYRQFYAMASKEFEIIDLRHPQLLAEDIDEDHLEIADTLDRIKTGVQGVDKHLTLTSTPITRCNYQYLQNSYQISPIINAGYIRWNIERGYRQPITPDIYDHWFKGGLHHLNQFISLYSLDSDLQFRDLQQSIAGYAIPVRDHITARTKFIREALTCVFGSYANLDKSGYVSKVEINERLQSFIDQHSISLWKIFGWRKAHDAQPKNVFNRLLGELGLDLKRENTGINQKKYYITPQSLAKMSSYYEAYHAARCAEAPASVIALAA